jgi:ParB family chromosome partitioning protein
MALFGASADQIARKTRTPKTRIDTALAVAGSLVASKAIESYQLTIDDAAVFVEFEDSVDAIDKLTDTLTSKPEQFAHEVARLRTFRQEQQAHADKVAELEAAGITVLADRPDWQSPYKRLSEYFADENHTRRATQADVDPKYLFGCIVMAWGEGNVRVPAIDLYIKDHKAAGVFPPRTSIASGSAGGGLSDEEKAKRKVTRDNNKLWAPATTVRLAWVKELLARKELPKGWQLRVSLGLLTGYFNGYDGKQKGISAQVLGDNINYDKLDKYSRENPDRAGHVLLALAIGRIEGEYEYFKKGWEKTESIEHLKQLSAWGYTLSDIEAAVVAGTAKNGLS